MEKSRIIKRERNGNLKAKGLSRYLWAHTFTKIGAIGYPKRVQYGERNWIASVTIGDIVQIRSIWLERMLKMEKLGASRGKGMRI
jgi:hypothetical protein